MCQTARTGLLRSRSRNWAWDGSHQLRSRRGSTRLDRDLDARAVRRSARRRWWRASRSRLTVGARDRWLHLRPIRWAARGEHRSSRLLRWCPARALGRSGGGWLHSDRLRGGLWCALRLRRRLGGWLRSDRLRGWLRCALRLRRRLGRGLRGGLRGWLRGGLRATAEDP